MLGSRTSTFALALLAALTFTPAVAGAQDPTVYVSVDGVDGPACGASPGAAACRTLGGAVAIAPPGSIVQFGPGDFPVMTDMAIAKRLDLRGAGYDSDARARPAGFAETVLRYAASVPAQGLISLQAGAAGTSIRGFTISGTIGGPNHAGAGVLTPLNGDEGGYRISENIITGNAIGIFLNSSGDATMVSENVISDSVPGTPAGGNGLYGERARNVTIEDNLFRDNLQAGSIDSHLGGGGANVSFTGNESRDESGMAFTQIEGLTVTGNSMTGGNFRAFTLGGHGLRDATLSGNVITGKSGSAADGIRLINFRGGEPNRDVTIVRNTITGTESDNSDRGNAIWITPNGAGDDIRIADNRIVGNSGAGLRNDDPDADVVARGNWWGCNDGPGSADCDGVTSPGDASNPSFTPWLTLSLTAIPAEIDAGASATLLGELANLSSGGLADGPFFATAQAAFATTPAGTLTPPTALLAATDLRAQSAFTAGQRPTELSVTVDNETVSITNADPPEPDIVPDIRPSDPTLRPGQREEIIVELVNRGNQIAGRIEACLRVSAKLLRTGERCRRIARLRPGHTLIFRMIARAKLNACRGRIAHELRVRVAGQPLAVRRVVTRLLAGRCGPPAPCPRTARASRAPQRIVGDRIRVHAAC